MPHHQDSSRISASCVHCPTSCALIRQIRYQPGGKRCIHLMCFASFFVTPNQHITPRFLELYTRYEHQWATSLQHDNPSRETLDNARPSAMNSACLPTERQSDSYPRSPCRRGPFSQPMGPRTRPLNSTSWRLTPSPSDSESASNEMLASSKAFVRSDPFCLAKMGCSWAVRHTHFPILLLRAGGQSPPGMLPTLHLPACRKICGISPGRETCLPGNSTSIRMFA